MKRVNLRLTKVSATLQQLAERRRQQRKYDTKKEFQQRGRHWWFSSQCRCLNRSGALCKNVCRIHDHLTSWQEAFFQHKADVRTSIMRNKPKRNPDQPCLCVYIDRMADLDFPSPPSVPCPAHEAEYDFDDETCFTPSTP